MYVRVHIHFIYTHTYMNKITKEYFLSKLLYLSCINHEHILTYICNNSCIYIGNT